MKKESENLEPMMAKELQAACLRFQPENMTVDEVLELLEKNDKGFIKNTVTNSVTISSKIVLRLIGLWV